ncbi:MAG: type II toxin-antitoxin system VapC family toxin [Clostridiales bacterium]|nr:type II toxin-antitoxin system VapC family toxin [Clostridiales bacterium]
MGIDSRKHILLDTNCFIYYFEDNPNYSDKLEKMFTDIQNGNCEAFMSIISFMEILVKPKKENNIFIENRYKLMLTNYPNLSIINVDYKIADIASRLRAEHNIKTPDAIILATGISKDVNFFITNDIRLNDICNKVGVKGIILENLVD